MLKAGLLWFDDDARRPLAQKIADAVARYQERLGERPSVCQVNPGQAATLATGKGAPPQPLLLVPDATLRPNYFLVGVDSGAVESGQAPELPVPPSVTPPPTTTIPATAAPATMRLLIFASLGLSLPVPQAIYQRHNAVTLGGRRTKYACRPSKTAKRRD